MNNRPRLLNNRLTRLKDRMMSRLIGWLRMDDGEVSKGGRVTIHGFDSVVSQRWQRAGWRVGGDGRRLLVLNDQWRQKIRTLNIKKRSHMHFKYIPTKG